MIPLPTQPVPAPTETGRHSRGEYPQRRDPAAGDQAVEFDPGSGLATIERAGAEADHDRARAVATARDALKFRLQITPMPGPGSMAAFVAQQIGQMWIMPEPVASHDHAAAAYARAIATPTYLRTDSSHHRTWA